MEPGRITEGSPEPLGVSPTASGVNVAVASSSATAIDLCLFDAAGAERRVRLPGRTGEVFHGHVEGVGEGALYGLRAHGDYEPARGLRFDPTKLLLDPFAAAIDRPLQLHPSLFAGPAEGLDTAPFMAKALVTPPIPPVPPPLVVPWEDTVIYEAHVRGLTRLHPEIPDDVRGTFTALAHPAVLEHLTSLGVTTLELLPAAASIDERHLPPLGLRNYWGYNPVAFCAPDPRLAPGGWAEVRAATAALNAAGIETIIDVVFNHTGEGDELGPTLSLRGLDNRGYYWLRPDDPARYVDDAGTGNTLRLDTARGVRLAMESMRAWVRRGGVSGFRFDLATVLGRRANGFDPEAPLLAAIAQDPELRDLKLIAEPWDCGPGGYQLGRFPHRWGEWNDRFRDTVRRFWKGDVVSLGALAQRLAGSQEAFAPRHRPSRSVNFVTAHDGFTLADLVSYARKHNHANGEANRDGADHNTSWNNGAEGPSEDPQIVARRAADQRALLATLFFARGTPMFSMGAELGHSQGGNNNAYAQDNATSWIDWASADPGLTAFLARLARLRRTHPALREDRFLTGEAQGGPLQDVAWLRPDGAPMSAADWDDPSGAGLQMILTAAEAADRVAVLVNRGELPLAMTLPSAQDGQAWRLEIDTADPERASGVASNEVALAARSVALLAEVPDRRPTRGAADAAVAALAAAAGISPEWWSLDGVGRPVSPQTQRAILAAMDLPAATGGQVRDSLWRLGADRRDPLPACRVVRAGEALALRIRAPERWLTLEREDGTCRPIPILEGEARLPALAPGRYRLRLGAWNSELIVAPSRAYEPPSLKQGARLFGLSAQLYALAREGDQGVGDFTTLAELGGLAAAAGAGLIALNPLHMLFPQDRSRASPYHPSDRRFIDPLYLDLAKVNGAHVPPGLGSPSQARLIDYPSVWAAKAVSLEAAAAEIERSGWARADRDAFGEAGGKALTDFCVFQALAEQFTGPWSQWPAPFRDPDHPEVAAFAAANAERVRRHQTLQWLCDRQLAEAAARAPGLGLCRDLAVGAAPDGAESWASVGRLAMAASIGAPPDAFAPQGQVWGLPPPIPQRWRAEAYRGFAELLRANMAHAHALRVDHVLGLARLFWVPAGAEGSDGAYVSYPLDDLLGVLALESHRAKCLVIGEDLGTVPEGFRATLAETGVYGYGVLQFERVGAEYRPPSAYRAQAAACVSTHDLPPLAGWWEGADLEERIGLGLLADEDGAQARAHRAEEKAALLAALREHGQGDGWTADQPFSPALAAAIHAYVATSGSRLMLVQLDDLAGQRVGVNLPGTDRERPNWRLRTAPLAGLPETETWRAILAAVATARLS